MNLPLLSQRDPSTRARDDLGSQLDFHPWNRNNHLTIRQVSFELLSHPFHRGRIAVNQQNLFWGEPFRVCNQRLSGGVSAKLKLFDVTTQRLRPLVGIERHKVTGLGCAQNSARRLRVSVADE